MIISRTPFRISFFGGGTDYTDWYLQNGGSVLATAIDKYCYITCRYLPPFFEHRIRLVYSKVELCQNLEEVQHPSIRETLRFLNITRGIEIHHDGDLPARSGVGSSSSFTVGLLNALYALRGEITSKKQLAIESIHIEQNMIKETVGSQDQVTAAYGNLNHIVFYPDGNFEVIPLTVSKKRIKELKSNLMLFYTGIKRTASDVAESYVKNMQANGSVLRKMNRFVEEGISILQSESCSSEFGELLHDTWKAKRALSSCVTNDIIDQLYDRARANGAIGGKIIGAGGGGFLLLFIPKQSQNRVRNALSNLIHVPFEFEINGSQIIFYDPNQKDYSKIEDDRSGREIDCFRELSSI